MKRRKRQGGLFDWLLNKPSPWQAPPRPPRASLPCGPLLVTLSAAGPLPKKDLFEDFINRRLWHASLVSLGLRGIEEKSDTSNYSLKHMLLTQQRLSGRKNAQPHPFVDVVIWASGKTYRVLARQQNYLQEHLAILEDEHRRVFGRKLDGIAVRYFFALDDMLPESSEDHPVLTIQFGETVQLPDSENNPLVLKIKPDDHNQWRTGAVITGIMADNTRQFQTTIATAQTRLLLRSTKHSRHPQGLLRFAQWPQLGTDWLLLELDPSSHQIVTIEGTDGPIDFAVDVYGSTVMLRDSQAKLYLSHAQDTAESLKKTQYQFGYLEFAGFAIPELEQDEYQRQDIVLWQLYLTPNLKGIETVERNKSHLISNARKGYVCIIALRGEEKGMIYSDLHPEGVKCALHPVRSALISHQLTLHPLHKTVDEYKSVLLADEFASLGSWELSGNRPEQAQVQLDTLPLAEVFLDSEHIPVACLPQRLQLTFYQDALDDWFIKDRQTGSPYRVLRQDLSERSQAELGTYVAHGDYIVLHNYVLRFLLHENQLSSRA